MKTLRTLVENLVHKTVDGTLDLPVTGIAYHSKRVMPGNLFACLEGTRGQGESYASEAVAAGAVAIMSAGGDAFPGVTTVRVPDVRLALALLAAEYFDYPSRQLILTGVTGTNGKTTTTHLIDALLRDCGAVTGLIGTVHYLIGGREYPVWATTPEANDLQGLLREMCDCGATHATMEVSSHALALYRTVGCDFDTVVLTNITEDHLDFHKTFSHYLGAKSKLFSWLGSAQRKGSRLRRAIINGDDRHYLHIVDQVPGESLLYGLSPHCHVRAENINVSREGVGFTAITPAGVLPLHLKLTGLFSVYNSLAAVSYGLLEGMDPERIGAVLEGVDGVPGRFELIDEGQDFTVIVDYAHTPDGLENVLRAVREFAKRRVITVFGCGGERDRGKRPLMGEVAANYSDYCLVTSDNPRGEDPDQIIKEILPGLTRGRCKSSFEVIPDRFLAIERALVLAEAEDVVIITGKGHETQQIFKDHIIPFDDRKVVREMIRRQKSYGNELQGDSGGGRG
ncbi:MAG: UDP-N-acetylmuramoyl-L-alanyl-D-glutamate--2,6-diaminopimelate ligase [Dethiobacter sp.]|jgi:UDP-N-acetylmuramyl-tripeptide synthetase|nr:UDP-N-acetylmuramoyl-L-alanyl-D-glutamate--2,6-diaminopimelate ligase [Dethiobacter sp.]